MNDNRYSLWLEGIGITLLFVAILVAFFYPAFFQDRTIYIEDHVLADSFDLNIPRRVLAWEAWRNYGEFPLWEPKIGGGAPLFAESEAGVLYPSILLFGLSNISLANNLAIVSAMLIAMLGTYAWARSFDTARLPAIVAACSFGLGEVFFLRTSNMNILHTIAWLPASLALITLGLTSGKRLYWLLLSLVWSLQMLTSHFQFTAICQMGNWVYLLLLLFLRPQSLGASRRRLISYALAALLLTIGMCSVQLLPTREFLPTTSRQTAYSFDYLRKQSLHWHHLQSLLDPYYLTKIVNKPGMPLYQNVGSVHEYTIYCGLVPLILCLGAFAKKQRYLALTLLLLGGLFLLLALGPDYGLYSLFWHYCPFIKNFRNPTRFIIVTMVCLSGLAAIGGNNCYVWLREKWGTRCSQALLGILIILTAGELGYINNRYQGYLEQTWQQAPPSALSQNFQRIFSPFVRATDEYSKANMDKYPRAQAAWLHRSLLPPGISTLWGLASLDDYVFHGGGITPYRSTIIQFACNDICTKRLTEMPGSREVMAALWDWLRVQGVSHVLSPSALPAFWPQEAWASVQQVAVPEIPGQTVYIYALNNPLPLVRLAPALQKGTPAGALNLCKYLGVDDSNDLYETSIANPPQVGTVAIVSRTNHTLTVQSTCEQDAFLIVAATYDNNWQASIDNSPFQPVQCVDINLQSVPVPAGTHTIRLRYSSPAFKWGGLIGGATLALWLGLLIVELRRSRLTRSTSSPQSDTSAP